jgi:general secretion pathway protein B
VPGLHAQPVPVPSLDDARARRTPWAWITAGVSAVLLVLILWRSWSAEPLVDEAALARAPVGGNVSQGSAEPTPSPAPPPQPAAPPPVQAAAAPPAAPPPPAQTAAPPPAAPSPPAPAAKAPRSTKPATPSRSSATAAPRREMANDKALAATAPPNTAAPTGVAAAPRPPTAPPPVPERLPKLDELPDDLRRSVPQLAFGGSVYSDTPAQRMVIFNNQVMREGDAVTNELQIEQIRPRSAVLRVRGQRFEMVF